MKERKNQGIKIRLRAITSLLGNRVSLNIFKAEHCLYQKNVWRRSIWKYYKLALLYFVWEYSLRSDSWVLIPAAIVPCFVNVGKPFIPLVYMWFIAEMQIKDDKIHYLLCEVVRVKWENTHKHLALCLNTWQVLAVIIIDMRDGGKENT